MKANATVCQQGLRWQEVCSVRCEAIQHIRLNGTACRILCSLYTAAAHLSGLIHVSLAEHPPAKDRAAPFVHGALPGWLRGASPQLTSWQRHSLQLSLRYLTCACFHTVAGGDTHCALQTSLEKVVEAVEYPDTADIQRLGRAADWHWLQHERDEQSRRLCLTLGQAMSACLSSLEEEMLTGAYGLGSEPPLGVCGVRHALGML